MPERLEQTIRIVEQKYALALGSFTENRRLFGSEWEREFDELLATMFPDDASLEKALNGYAEFIVDSMRLQTQFQDERAYLPQAYDDVAAEVYQNEAYMTELYLPGILVSHYLWVHHYRQLVFFKNSLLRDIGASADPRFHDVGVGTGFYSNAILKNVPGARGRGWDLSPHSLAHAERLVGRFGAASRYRLRRADILDTPDIEPLPFLVCVEVLEHLEDPGTFMRGLHRMLGKGGKAFITAAINAPNKDHIYLYRNPQEVIEQLLAAGFAVEQYLSAAAYPPRKYLRIVPELGAFIVTR